MWKRESFGWEYKGKRKNLDAAFDQLLLYRESLEDPPLLVACDMDRIRAHTNFTEAVNQLHEMRTEDPGEPRNLEILRAAFFGLAQVGSHRDARAILPPAPVGAPAPDTAVTLERDEPFTFVESKKGPCISSHSSSARRAASSRTRSAGGGRRS